MKYRLWIISTICLIAFSLLLSMSNVSGAGWQGEQLTSAFAKYTNESERLWHTSDESSRMIHYVYLPLVMVGSTLTQPPEPTPSPTPSLTPEPTPTGEPEPARWTNEGPYGGYVKDLVMSYSDPDVLYAYMWGAGLFYTDNGGYDWWRVASPPGGINCLAIAPHTPDVVYAGTANGIYKSITGGYTWTHTGLTGILVKDIAIQPSNPQIIYVVATSEDSTDGVFKSPDAGQTWQHKFSETDLIVNTLLIDTTNPNRIYLGVGFGAYSVLEGIRISDDGGNSWTSHKVMSQWSESVTVLAMTPPTHSPPTLYANAESAVYKSTDGGLTWTKAWGNLIANIHSLTVDWRNPNVVYAGDGGTRLIFPNDPGYPRYQGFYSKLWQSSDGGTTWDRKDDGLPGEFIHRIVIDPRTSHLFVGLRSGGVYRSTDMGASWQFASQGIRATYINDLAVDPGGSARVIAAISGYGHPMAVTTGAGAPWDYTIANNQPTNVGAVVVDPTNSSTWYTGDGMIGRWQWVYTFRSNDSGNTWNANQVLSKPDGEWGETIYHRVYDLEVDPNNPSTVLAAVYETRTAYSGVYKSSDAGTSWFRTLPDWVTALAFDPQSPGRVYAGALTYGTVFRSTDSGTTWTQIGGSTIETHRVHDITVDLNGHVYAATSEGLQKWDGTDWQLLTGLPPGATRTLAIDIDANPSVIYVGMPTYNVYVSKDGGATWTDFNNGLPNISITTMAISSSPMKTLYAGTEYGGVWRIVISEP